MNTVQKQQVAALTRLDPPRGGQFDLLIRNLAWRLEHEPTAPLSWRERFNLACAIYGYRRGLRAAGVAFAIPEAEPRIEEYRPVIRENQRRLF